jgi:hypothetical protein
MSYRNKNVMLRIIANISIQMGQKLTIRNHISAKRVEIQRKYG